RQSRILHHGEKSENRRIPRSTSGRHFHCQWRDAQEKHAKKRGRKHRSRLTRRHPEFPARYAAERSGRHFGERSGGRSGGRTCSGGTAETAAAIRVSVSELG